MPTDITKSQIAENLWLSGKIKEAVTVCKELENSNLATVDDYLMLAKCLFFLKNYTETIDYCNKILDMQSNLVVPKIMRAYVYLRQGQKSNAIQELEIINIEGDTSEAALVWYANIQIELGKTDIALNFLNKAIELHPNSIPAHVNLSRVYFIKRKYISLFMLIPKLWALESTLVRKINLITRFFIMPMVIMSVFLFGLLALTISEVFIKGHLHFFLIFTFIFSILNLLRGIKEKDKIIITIAIVIILFSIIFAPLVIYAEGIHF